MCIAIQFQPLAVIADVYYYTCVCVCIVFSVNVCIGFVSCFAVLSRCCCSTIPNFIN